MSDIVIERPSALEEAPVSRSAEIAPARLLPLDMVRGLLVIVMALDHANLFIAHQHSSGEFWNRPLPHYESALAFLTRFVTHMAAPGFFFLMGAGMILFAEARRGLGWSEWQIARHFVVRGLALIGLQLLAENPAWQLGQPYQVTPIYIGVLYALGGAMIVGAALVRLGAAALIALGAAAVLATHLLPYAAQEPLPISPLKGLLLVPGFAESLIVYYPLLPWLGLACFGMAFGRWLVRDRAAAYRHVLAIGASFIVLFLIIRAAGGFGNIRPAEGAGWIAFLNVVKYPPNLTFILLTLGVDLLLLGLFARLGAALAWRGSPLLIFGQSALFFYLAHLYLYGALGLVVAPQGIGIARMYPFWLAGLLVLYFLCRWYGAFKRRQPPSSLWRLL